MAVTVHAPDVTLDDVLRRAEELVSRVRARAPRTEQLRRIPDETMQEFLDVRLFRVPQPKDWRGFELNYGRTQTELCNVLGVHAGPASGYSVSSLVTPGVWQGSHRRPRARSGHAMQTP